MRDTLTAAVTYWVPLWVFKKMLAVIISNLLEQLPGNVKVNLLY